MPYILQTNNLTKTIGGKDLVNRVSPSHKKRRNLWFSWPKWCGQNNRYEDDHKPLETNKRQH